MDPTFQYKLYKLLAQDQPATLANTNNQIRNESAQLCCGLTPPSPLTSAADQYASLSRAFLNSYSSGKITGGQAGRPAGKLRAYCRIDFFSWAVRNMHTPCQDFRGKTGGNS